jgi:uncharacterized protein (TIGR02118 family)
VTLKLVFCLHRLPGLSRTEFQDHWRRVHAPLVLERAALLRIRRYVQSHTLEDPRFAAFLASRGGREAYDGIAELWFESFDDLAAGQDDPRVQQAGRELREDEQRFIDLPRSPMFFAQEHEVVAYRGP